jgi:precorrin-6A/cobalt-precorrin-6A reductase
MILVLGGTKDGRDLTALLTEKGYQVMVSVFSDYGRDLLQLHKDLIHTGPLDAGGFSSFIHKNNIHLIVDASHPYAINVSENAMKACQTANIPYIRYERPAATLPTYDGLHVVHDYNQAAQLAATLGKVIFLTTGSRHLYFFKTAASLQKHRVIARVLPEPSVLAECLQLGFKPQDIVAIQGPFSHNLNVSLFQEYKTEVIVTKNSGKIGGSDTKITAAMALNLPLVMIDRPIVHYSKVVYDITDVINFIREVPKCSI